MRDFRVLRTLDGVELVPQTPAARAFLVPHRLDGVDVNRWVLTSDEWPAFRQAIAANGLTLEEAP